MPYDGRGCARRPDSFGDRNVRPLQEAPVTDTTRYTKTEKGAAELRSRGQNLRGRMRTMLILIDPSKTADELRASAAQIGVEPEFLATLMGDGYIAEVAGTASGTEAAPTPEVSKAELGRFHP